MARQERVLGTAADKRDRRPGSPSDPGLWVLAPMDPLQTNPKRKGKHGRGTVYDSWLSLELTRRLIETYPEIQIPDDNRRLVEAVYHPDIIQDFLDNAPVWQAAWENDQGQDFARSSHGHQVALDFTTTYMEQAHRYRTNERQIRTRLGSDDITVQLDEPVAARFVAGATQETVDLPLWLLVKVGVSDLTSPGATRQSDRNGETVYLLNGRTEIRYGPFGWTWD